MENLAFLKEFGIAGMIIIAVGYLVEKVLQYRSKPTESQARDDYRKRLDEMADQVKQLYDWHDRMDDDGVPVWYVRKSLENAIAELVVAINKQSQLLQRWIDRHEN